MRIDGQRESDNIEDRRGIGGLVLAVSYFTDTNPFIILNLLTNMRGVTSGPAESVPDQAIQTGSLYDLLGKFAAIVLTNTSAVGPFFGPFYCPGDHKVYLDLSFFNALSQRLGAPGDFAQAYVIAHEVGHHVQNLIGIAAKVYRLQRQASDTQRNALSVRMELRADCLAGVWGHHAKRERNLIESGDFEEGLRTASAISDDRLQKMSHSYVQPESWTHDSSEQRMMWLRRGLESGNPSACNTFESTPL